MVRNLEQIETYAEYDEDGNLSGVRTKAKMANRRMALQDLLKVYDKISPSVKIHVIGWDEALSEAYGKEKEDGEDGGDQPE